MKNYEKYADEIREYKGDYFCNDFVKPNILESDCCDGVNCSRCYMLQMLWLMEEYKEPEEPEEPKTDWSKVEVDTPIWVRDHSDSPWEKRHFAEYLGGRVYAWDDGKTSWNMSVATSWKYAELAETEDVE